MIPQRKATVHIYNPNLYIVWLQHINMFRKWDQVIHKLLCRGHFYHSKIDTIIHMNSIQRKATTGLCPPSHRGDNRNAHLSQWYPPKKKLASPICISFKSVLEGSTTVKWQQNNSQPNTSSYSQTVARWFGQWFFSSEPCQFLFRI